MVLGQICFKFPEGSENKTGTGVRVPIYVITSKKIEEKEVTKTSLKECTIEKVCEKPDDCPSAPTKPARIQLKSINRENPEKSDRNCYQYRVFISPGKYHMQCDNKCSAHVISHYGSSLRDINFTLSGKPLECK